jgi:hypothetical protein
MIKGSVITTLLSLLAHAGTAVAQSSVQPAAVTPVGIPSNSNGPPPDIHFCDGAAQESKDWSFAAFKFYKATWDDTDSKRVSVLCPTLPQVESVKIYRSKVIVLIWSGFDGTCLSVIDWGCGRRQPDRLH